MPHRVGACARGTSSLPVPARYTPVGRSFFSPPEGYYHPLGGGREVWFGFHQSVRPAMWKMMLNIDGELGELRSQGHPKSSDHTPSLIPPSSAATLLVLAHPVPVLVPRKEEGINCNTFIYLFIFLKDSEPSYLSPVPTVSATAFYKAQPVIEFMCEVLDIRNIDEQPKPLTDSQRVRFTKEIKGEDPPKWGRESTAFSDPNRKSPWERPSRDREQPVSTLTSSVCISGLKVEVTHCGQMKRKYRVCNVTRRPASHQT